MKRYVIVGGGVAGVTAAETIRRRDPRGTVTLLHGDEPPIFRAALSTYLFGDIGRDELRLRPADWADRRGVDLRPLAATGVESGAKRVMTGAGPVPYDALLLATGATPRLPDWPGAQTPGVFVYRTMADGDGIRSWLASRPARGVVVGGGILSVELAELLAGRGVAVTLVMREPRLLARHFPASLADEIARRMAADGVTLVARAEVVRIDGDADRVRQVTLTNGAAVDTDMVAVAVGVRPATPLGDGATVDARLRVVGHDALWSAGDCVTGAHLCRTWLTAARMGERAGRNMTGDDGAFGETFFNASHVWGRHYALIGAFPHGDEGEPLREADGAVGRYREGRLTGAALRGDLRPARRFYETIRRGAPSLPYGIF